MRTGALILLVASAASIYAANVPVPERQPLDRYAKMKNDAPFAVATDNPVAPPPTIPWSEGLHLSSAMQINEAGTVTDMAIVNDTNQPGTLITLIGNQPDKSGLQLVKLEWNPNPILTKATVKKGSETAVLERDKAAFNTPVAPQQPPGMVRPNQPPGIPIPNAGNQIRPPNTAIPRPPQIPRPQGAVAPPQPVLPQAVQGTQNQQNQPGSDRRRIRVINSR